MQKGFTHILLILGILILAVSYWGYTKLESDKESVSQNPFVASTPTDIPIVTGLPDKITATPIISESKTYTSEKLGVSFQYSPTYGNLELKIVENGNRIYVGSSDYLTQYIEIFETESNLSVVEDIEKRFLTGYPKDVCFINTSVPNTQDAGPANTNFKVVKIEVSQNLTLDEYTTALVTSHRGPLRLLVTT